MFRRADAAEERAIVTRSPGWRRDLERPDSRAKCPADRPACGHCALPEEARGLSTAPEDLQKRPRSRVSGHQGSGRPRWRPKGPTPATEASRTARAALDGDGQAPSSTVRTSRSGQNGRFGAVSGNLRAQKSPESDERDLARGMGRVKSGLAEGVEPGGRGQSQSGSLSWRRRTAARIRASMSFRS